MFTRFVANSEKMSQIRVSRGPTQIITILHRRGHWNLLQYYKGGGLPDLLQYYKGEGGVSRDPKFVLRNIWTAPKKKKLKSEIDLKVIMSLAWALGFGSFSCSSTKQTWLPASTCKSFKSNTHFVRNLWDNLVCGVQCLPCGKQWWPSSYQGTILSQDSLDLDWRKNILEDVPYKFSSPVPACSSS